MDHTMEAIYENGVFRPIKSLTLPERQRVVLTIHPLATESPESELVAWQQVYSGLSDPDISEIESLALDRRRFTDRKDS